MACYHDTMKTYFHGIKTAFWGLFIVYVLSFVFASYFFKLYAKEGRACCLQSDCDFGYTCIAPKNCDIKQDPGSCTKTQNQCSPGTLYCPPGQYCVDYICITLGPGTPTPGGGQTRPRMRHEFANSWTLAARNCAIIFAKARS